MISLVPEKTLNIVSDEGWWRHLEEGFGSFGSVFIENTAVYSRCGGFYGVVDFIAAWVNGVMSWGVIWSIVL